MPIKKLWGREKKSEREENKTVRKQWPLHRVTEWCLSLRLGRALFSDRRFCGLPSSHSTHRLKGFASGWHNECVCVCVCMHACLCMCKCTLEGPCCVEPESECDSLRGRRGRGFVQAHARGCVCARLTSCLFTLWLRWHRPWRQMPKKNCVPIPFWPTESGR